MPHEPSSLIFGASGSLGGACLKEMSKICPTYSVNHNETNYTEGAPFSSVIWAQGTNKTQSFMDSTDSDWNEMLEANLHFVRRSALKLVTEELIQHTASFVFIGSIWANFARKDKSSYIVSKSALDGLTRSLAIDLAPFGVRVNSVLPGVINNSMTRKNLSQEQIEKIEQGTPTLKLAEPSNVASVVRFLATDESIGINGQSLVVDNGWSIARSI
jgi:NAD(P)-dependent dehydrogenase (short-subunit alcohol dehydrogenase family)